MNIVQLVLWGIGLSLMLRELIRLISVYQVFRSQKDEHSANISGSAIEFARNIEVDRSAAKSWNQKLGLVVYRHQPTRIAKSLVKVRNAELWAVHDTATTLVAPIVADDQGLTDTIARFTRETPRKDSVAGIFVEPEEDIHFALERCLTVLSRKLVSYANLWIGLTLAALFVGATLAANTDLYWPIWLLCVASFSGTIVAAVGFNSCYVVALFAALCVATPQIFAGSTLQPAAVLAGVGVLAAASAARAITTWRVAASVIAACSAVDIVSFLFGPTKSLRFGILGSGESALEALAVIEPPFGDWAVGAIDVTLVCFASALAIRLGLSTTKFILLISVFSTASLSLLQAIPFLPVVALSFLFCNPSRTFAELEGRL